MAGTTLVMGDVAVFVVLGRGPVRGGAQDSKRNCRTGRGCSHLVREEVRGQRSLWPPERLGPHWHAVGLPILPGFAGVGRHHVHAMQLEQFHLGNNPLRRCPQDPSPWPPSSSA